MLTIVDLGHKPRSSCYLIELDLYPDSEHKPIHILVDAPIEISDILDFVPNDQIHDVHNQKQFKNKKTNWKLDDSGKQWIIGNKSFKDSPFYFTVPFKKTFIKSNNSNKPTNNQRENTNTKKRKFPKDEPDEKNNDNSNTLPPLLRQKQIFVDIVLISNHESILGLPYLFKPRNHQTPHNINHDLNNMHHDANMNNLLHSLLSTDAIAISDILTEQKQAQQMEIDTTDAADNSTEIVMCAHCKIYATAPTKQYGKLLMKSLASSNNEYFVLNANKRCIKNGVYDIDLIEACIDSITTCEYNERIAVVDSGELSIVCISSGLYIGSSNWIINGAAMNAMSIGIVMGSCGATNRHPKSITLSPYFNNNAMSTLLIDDLQSILLNDESANDSLLLMEKKIISTISGGGSVIMPSTACGIAYDMLERIHSILNRYDYSYISIYFISSIAKESICYSSVYGEYLHANNMKHVSDAKYPFGFQTYILHNRLIHCCSWDNKFCFKYIKQNNCAQSRIIICESPSLRYGNVLHLLQIFNDKKNTLILTDPHFITHLALYPFSNHSMAMDDNKTASDDNSNNAKVKELKLEIVSYPIDARLQIKELCVLLRKVCPKYAFIPNNYYKRIMQNMNKFININMAQFNKQQKNEQKNSNNNSLLISPVLLRKIKDIKYFTMNSGVYHCIPFDDNGDDEKRNYKVVYIDPLISQNIYPKNINPNHSNNMFVASLCGDIDYNTHKNKLILTNKQFINQKFITNKTFIGALNIYPLLNNLKQQTNIDNIQHKANENIIEFYMKNNNNNNIKIQILTSDNVTSIGCNSPLNKQTITHILDLVSQHLVSF